MALKILLIENCNSCHMRAYADDDPINPENTPSCTCTLLCECINKYMHSFHPRCPLMDFPKEIKRISKDGAEIDIELRSDRPVTLIDASQHSLASSLKSRHIAIRRHE